jgi:hypothetical protein
VAGGPKLVFDHIAESFPEIMEVLCMLTALQCPHGVPKMFGDTRSNEWPLWTQNLAKSPAVKSKHGLKTKVISA